MTSFFDPGKGKARMIVPASMDRPTIDSVIEEIENQSWFKGQIVHRKAFSAKEGTLGVVYLTFYHQLFLTAVFSFSLATFDLPLSDTIMQALRESRKITSLYSHQEAAISAIAKGKNVIVATSTASGKSVIYQVHKPYFSFDTRFTLSRN